MIKRAIISGLHSTGIQVADLRTLPAPVGKHHLKTQGYDAAFHVGAASHDPEAVQIRLFERTGIALSAALQKEIEKHYPRQELRRVPFSEVGDISYPARARETYAHDLPPDLPERLIAAGFAADAVEQRRTIPHELHLRLPRLLLDF